MAVLKTKRCRCCEGSGRELDHKAVGEEMRKIRADSGISQAVIARRMGVTPAYLCDLESGNRNWRPELVQRFRKACEKK